MAKEIKCWESNDGQKFDSKDEALRRDALMFSYDRINTKEITPNGYNYNLIIDFLVENRASINEIYRILDGKA